jgi:hypothetical protein
MQKQEQLGVSTASLSLSILGIGNQDDPKTSRGGGCELPSFCVTMEGNKLTTLLHPIDN